ncbi:TetR family transcriptional regulator [Mycolicibacterium moriokaense]|jgi:AcrR family transcriptional regulator|uniref:TetR family transcriptional regulator n=1 Tax=Mycolicibacterium moriokaense TaxID=39691 RepID=A0AAD1HIE8_9MYCO|nr:TetR/AcrR family transcriptional regulator [Mycolicibacterium moriokaense]MCV7042036.1 TetR/AcrR family transcriptional regulator [Mycolicibacterium moriokaense]ORB25114.1 TetR family transcriptional regulator [Mycolicibacterium moriokaense]BBX04806.1 TetR family transcriptional regulator [Mycolicibacterium moriokaense]
MARPRKFDEADVIAAAREQFWTRGYGATSVDDLTAVTGLGKGSLYGAFGDKHGLFLRALDDYIDTTLDDVRAQLNDPEYRAYERLTRHLRWQASSVAADKARRGCMVARTAAELGSSDDAVEDKIARVYEVWRGELANTIAEAQRDADIDKKVDPQTLAGTLLAFMRGVESLHVGGTEPAELERAAEVMIGLIPTG